MIIKTVTIQGFKSFDSRQVVDFDQFMSGLFFVTGVNKVDETLGANGAGKSTILDAICWALYGKTTSKLKASNIKNWKGTSPCEVSIFFEKDGDEFSLTRKQSPNSIILNGTTVTDDDVEKVIGLDFTGFLYSIFVSQFSSKFFDLDPSEKLKVFSDIMESIVKKWEGFSDKAKTLVSEKETQGIELSRKKASLLGKIEELEKMNYAEESVRWEKGKEEKINRIVDDIFASEARIEDYNGKIDEIKAKRQEKTDSILGKEEAIFLKKEELSFIEEELLAQQSKHSVEVRMETQLSTKFDMLAEELKKVEALSDSCPFCRQPISEKHIAEETVRIEKQLEALNKELVEAEKKVETISVSLKNMKAQHNECSLSLKSLEADLKKVLDSITRDDYEAQNILNKMKMEDSALTKNIEKRKEAEKEVNPYTKIIEENTSKLVQLKEEVSSINDRCTSNTQITERYKYWIKGFKNIRLFLIEEALKEFEIHINNNLAKLGLPNWKVSLLIDAETKTGSVKRGFNVLVSSPISDQMVPFECWSGGEGQRIRLAGTIGLMEFISSYKGVSCNIEAFDEPTAWLSKQGIEDLISVLRERAKEKDISILLIDHKDLNTYGEFSGIVEVEKTATGSTIKTYF